MFLSSSTTEGGDTILLPGQCPTKGGDTIVLNEDEFDEGHP